MKKQKLAFLGLFLQVFSSLYVLFYAIYVPVVKADVPNVASEDFSSSEIIVKFNDNYIDLSRRSGDWKSEIFADENNLEIIDSLPEYNLALLSPLPGETVQDAINRIGGDEVVEEISPNYEREITTNDSFFASQWALKNTGQNVNGSIGISDADIDIEEAWEIESEGEVVVAVIDTGVNYLHTDLRNKMWDGSNCLIPDDYRNNRYIYSNKCIHGYDFQSNDFNPINSTSTSDDFHGTHVAGVIAAEVGNNRGVAGIAPKARIMALRAGQGRNIGVFQSLQAIEFARINGAKIINASYGGYSTAVGEREVIEKFINSGGLFIAAAGNDGRNMESSSSNKFYPAAYDLDGIVSVASTNNRDELDGFSNFGSQSVDLGAPGSQILVVNETTATSSNYTYKNGTSFAAPQVAGVAALLFSYDNFLTPIEVKQMILSSGDSLSTLSGRTVSGRRLNAHKALLMAQSGVSLEVSTIAPTGNTIAIGNLLFSVRTNQDANCKFDTVPGKSFDNMSNTFTSTGGRVHAEVFINQHSFNNSYTYYVKCKHAEYGNYSNEHVVGFTTNYNYFSANYTPNSSTSNSIFVTAPRNDRPWYEGNAYNINWRPLPYFDGTYNVYLMNSAVPNQKGVFLSRENLSSSTQSIGSVMATSSIVAAWMNSGGTNETAVRNSFYVLIEAWKNGNKVAEGRSSIFMIDLAPRTSTLSIESVGESTGSSSDYLESSNDYSGFPIEE